MAIFTERKELSAAITGAGSGLGLSSQCFGSLSSTAIAGTSLGYLWHGRENHE